MVYYKKNHWNIMMINYIKIIKKFWALIILIIIPSIPYGIYGAIGIFIAIGIFVFFRWMNEFIIIENKNLLYKKGIIKTSKIKIPLSSISLIEFNKTIVDRILGLRRIKIESISPKDRKFGITLILKKDEVLEFKNAAINLEYIKDEENFKIDVKKAYKMSFKHLLILATLRSNIILGVGIIYSIIHLLNEVDKRFGIELKGMLLNNAIYGISSAHEIIGVLIYIVLLFVVVFSIILIFSILGMLSKYYKFRIFRKSNHLYIHHGLTTRRRYSIKVDNIHAIKIEQNFINQLLGLYTLKASVVGYGNEMSEDEVMFPLCTKNDFMKVIEEIVPEFRYIGDIHIPPKKTFNNFYISWTSYSVVFAVAFYLLLDKSFVGFIVVPIMILWRYLIKRNSALGTDKDILYFSSGSFIRRITLIKNSSMIECCRVVNLFQRRKKICDYRIRFYNQKKIDWIRVKNMDDRFYKNIKDKMDVK
ncbi:PH domain-containing protein [uncultured Clostridium sp.]|uniref:PH domain-containing protein n=1 Tax=uncultured Clostridium sp. TaxID=59620 RepID=UPI002619D055|nr:PH domain-containing protein [uncultured Clostridium sp.]